MARQVDEETLRHALAVLDQEARSLIVPMEEEGFTSEYRVTACRRASSTSSSFMSSSRTNLEQVALGNRTAGEHVRRPLSTGEQHFEVPGQ